MTYFVLFSLILCLLLIISLSQLTELPPSLQAQLDQSQSLEVSVANEEASDTFVETELEIVDIPIHPERHSGSGYRHQSIRDRYKSLFPCLTIEQ